MKIILGGVVVVLSVCLQLSWFGHIRPFGVMPNLVLITVVVFSLWANASSGLAAALVSGLLLDMSSGSDFGLRIAFFMVVVLAIVAGRQLGLQSESLPAVVVIMATSSLLYDLAVLATLRAPISSDSLIPVAVSAGMAVVIAIGVMLMRAVVESRRRNLSPSRELWQ